MTTTQLRSACPPDRSCSPHCNAPLAIDGHARPAPAIPRPGRGNARPPLASLSRHFPLATSLVGGFSGDTRTPRRGTVPSHRPEYGDVPGWAVPTADPRRVELVS